jgi:imidazole glycerol-phosphate synthase subunit HisH
MADIALIDYRAGNLTSVRKGFAAVGAALFTPAAPRDLQKAAAIVVPGVGHFNATTVLDREWRAAISDAVTAGVPLLGICLGLQWLFEGSEEAPELEGLGMLAGRCFRLPPPVKVPHVGWNSLDIIRPVPPFPPTRPSPLLEGVAGGTQVYFTHSFAAPITDDCAASTTHGVPFAAAVSRGNVHGVQFHPEKSGDAGLRILTNFVSLTRHAVQTHHRVP